MEQKKSVVLQAKFIEKFDYNGKTYYSHGVAFKNKDVGIYNCLKEDQTDFLEGHEAEYTIEKNLEQPKKSKIKLVKAKTTETTTQANNVTEQAKNTLKTGYKDDIDKYITFKKIDAVSFSASYAKDIITAIKGEANDFVTIADIILAWTLENLDKQK